MFVCQYCLLLLLYRNKQIVKVYFQKTKITMSATFLIFFKIKTSFFISIHCKIWYKNLKQYWSAKKRSRHRNHVKSLFTWMNSPFHHEINVHVYVLQSHIAKYLDKYVSQVPQYSLALWQGSNLWSCCQPALPGTFVVCN